MNTLSRAHTALFFNDPQSYSALCQQWRRLVNSDRNHELTAAHHLLYLALRGKDWRRAFTPPTNPHKLANGAFLSWKLFTALYELHAHWKTADLLAPFEGSITPQMMQALRHTLPTLNAYHYSPEQFANGAFPFNAYLESPIQL